MVVIREEVDAGVDEQHNVDCAHVRCKHALEFDSRIVFADCLLSSVGWN